MPRTSHAQTTSAFAQVQRQARQLLSKLRHEIRSKEADVLRLKQAESTLSGLTDLVVPGAGVKPAAPRRVGVGARINWGTVLEQLPKEFKASDVRKVRGVKNKRHTEIFAAITRWIDAGAVKRKERGLYERVQARQPKKAA